MFVKIFSSLGIRKWRKLVNEVRSSANAQDINEINID